MDTRALKSMILANLQDLRRFAYSLTSDVNDADDLTQIVVERLLTRPIPENVIPLSWMFRICKNAWIDEIRSRKVRATDDAVDISQIASSNTNDNQLEEASQKQRLQIAIDELPEPYRMVISLIIMSGLSYAETSQTLDLPIGTVMSRISRARKKLAEKLSATD
ncbi:RNA polymerase sigma factor [Brumicola nitratireducens]|uniref:Putative RpoE6 RNA polymerase sigma factor n=1 Tax=Glaciecola nitratireducens (strain JCM 12485 / KCTC 12276 / FR1064) TaxID=1085623 RepID=G4QDU2_GLANF|nr:RNA polymerase sigma factor [Glaciecola nitratireducens]AEP31121.1 putative RpoE6 RNA polymerase sigma factor [Glaciecola nitratireducens FR1064]